MVTRMPGEEPIKEEDLSKVKLEHTDTVERKGEMKPAFKCVKCGAITDYPTHCGMQMSLEENELKCDSCGETQPIPTHCKETMAPSIVPVE